MPRGEVWVSDEPLGAAAWVGPGEWPPSASLELALAPMLLRTFGRHPLRALGASRVNGRAHPAESRTGFSTTSGSRPRRAAAAPGSALMRPVLERCDAEGIGAFLNAGSERSRDLYARHGFEVTRRVELPHGGPPLWGMWRAPALARASSLLAALGLVAAGAAVALVASGPAEQGVPAAVSEELVVALAALLDVGAAAADHDVVAGARARPCRGRDRGR